MQVFVPSTDLAECARVLDNRRLGKQRVETYQIVLALLDLGPEKDEAGKWTGSFVERPAKGWRQHPAVLAWQDNIGGLLAYQAATCNEWVTRGYRDTCWIKTRDAVAYRNKDLLPRAILPYWWGDEAVHASHRAALLWKEPTWYSQFGWNEDPVYDYVWPTAAKELV